MLRDRAETPLGSPYAFFDGDTGFTQKDVKSAVDTAAASMERSHGRGERCGSGGSNDEVALAMAASLNGVVTVVNLTCDRLERTSGCRGLACNESAVSVITQITRRRLTC